MRRLLLLNVSRLGRHDLSGWDSLGLLQCPPLVCRGSWTQQLTVVQNGLVQLGEILSDYAGWPLMALAALALFFGPRAQRKRIGWLALVAACIWMVFVCIAKDRVVARYLMPAVVPLVVVGAAGLMGAVQWLAARGWGTGGWALAGVLLVSVFWPMTNTVRMILAPTQARLALYDRELYTYYGTNGAGLREAALEILAREADDRQPPLILVN